MKFLTLGAVVLASSKYLAFAAPTKTSTSYIPQFSPVFPEMGSASNVINAYNYGPYNRSATLPLDQLSGYPDPWDTPDPTSDEVRAVIDQINWNLVPDAPVRVQKDNGDFKTPKDENEDPYCWWSDTNCLTPKIEIPGDLHSCPNAGEWGLSFDDGPFNLLEADKKHADTENPFAEPALYNYMLNTNNQKAALFYIGSNVAKYPAAAKKALDDGHVLCIHTWSHPAMTTKSNAEAVSELYWSLKAVKEATGVTPKCWRPPQGDVDDRIRSIAWQMGLTTVMWDWDTNDWDMPAPNGGNLPPETVDGYFKKWIKSQKKGKEKTGHIVLQHELNSATVSMAEKWLPVIQNTFNVLPATSCNGIEKPYWEENFVYPLRNVAEQR
ncbi:hypothetical protein BDF20DRAFT_970080 [Mycotypha africana]|uniref:uncharacterized protein n=1 Tax=Mycotypha africana TaxID=64632 RepID=UPI0022FFC57E|nr:uncharacterized protein BDF20DRAFT_970080 [Mycotypha africana]KAI8988043.1 hypothetical protein BDF20DRAFT_970080 [Mycotypha africana]